MNHGLSLVAGEGFAKFGHVADYAIHAIAARRVGIGLGPQPGSFRPDILAPNLAVGEEKALLRRESIDFGLWLAL
jgi:hypothetical protein